MVAIVFPKAASTRGRLRVGLLIFKKAWFRSQQSIRVHTDFYVSRGARSQSLARHHRVMFVSRHRSHAYRYEASAARCYCWLRSKKIKVETKVSGKLFNKIIRPENGSHLPAVYICKYFSTNLFNQFFNTLKKSTTFLRAPPVTLIPFIFSL